MEPYYQDEWTTLYCGDCRDVLPTLVEEPSLVIADPPYGIGYKPSTVRLSANSRALSPAKVYPMMAGDDEPFDPSHLLRYRQLVLFGANHYADRLPPQRSWFVWDKLDGLTSKREVGFNNSSDVELAWSNVGGPARLMRHRWTGIYKSGTEANNARVHPTQKPVSIMVWLIENYSQPNELVLDPYVGSGPVLVAAKATGRRSIGVELSEEYCAITTRRLRQGVLDLGW